MAVEDNIVSKSGAWLNYGDLRLGQGREKARAFVLENMDVLLEIRDKVLKKRDFADLIERLPTLEQLKKRFGPAQVEQTEEKE